MLQLTSTEPPAQIEQEWLPTNIQWGEMELWATASNNPNKEAGKFQEGGTAMMTYGELIQHFDPEGSGCNELCLRHWTYMQLIGDDRIVTRIICGYSPCTNKKKDLGTVYQQHCHHLINKLKDDTYARACFCNNLL
jgi:hypothetical protein